MLKKKKKELASVQVFAVEFCFFFPTSDNIPGHERAHTFLPFLPTAPEGSSVLTAAVRPGGRDAERPPGEVGSVPARQLLPRALRFVHDETISDLSSAHHVRSRRVCAAGFFFFSCCFFCSNKRSTSRLIGDERMKGAERMR